MKRTVRERFEEKYVPEPNSGCWLWIANTSPQGYGLLSHPITRKNIPAHRVSYELYKNIIPEGLEIDHLCRVRCCVNPNHLEAVTHKENSRRGICAETHRKNSLLRTHCKKGHPYSVENLFFNSTTGARGCLACRKINEKRWRTENKEHLRLSQWKRRFLKMKDRQSRITD